MFCDAWTGVRPFHQVQIGESVDSSFDEQFRSLDHRDELDNEGMYANHMYMNVYRCTHVCGLWTRWRRPIGRALVVCLFAHLCFLNFAQKDVQNQWLRDLFAEGIHRNPGPNDDRFIVRSHNISSFPKHWPKALRWEADVVALQETRLGIMEQVQSREYCKDHGWDVSFGMAMKPEARSAQKTSSRTVSNGGVMIMAKSPHKCHRTWCDALYNKLFRSARWNEVSLPVGDGTHCITIASLYGISESSKGGEKAKLNDDIIADALERGVGFGATPYIICADVNEHPLNQTSIKKALESNWWFDATREMFGIDPPPTFCKSGVKKSMKGKGVTKIDTILVNRPARLALMSVRQIYKLVGPDHVAIEAVFNIPHFDVSYPVWHAPPVIPAKSLPNYPEPIANAIAVKAIQPKLDDFQTAIANLDLDKADSLWHEIACDYIKCAASDDLPPLVNNAGQRRGEPPVFDRHTVAVEAPVAGSGAASAHLRDLYRIDSRLRELFWAQKRMIQRRYANLDIHDGHAIQITMLWRRVYRTWGTCCARKHVQDVWPHIVPPLADIMRLKHVVTHEIDRLVTAGFEARKSRWKEHMRSDAKSNHGRDAYKYIRGNYSAPICAIHNADVPMQCDSPLIANPEQICNAFVKDWEVVFHKHHDIRNDDASQQVKQFLDKYRDHIPYQPFEVRAPSGKELQLKAQDAIGTAGGLDGWRGTEVAILPHVIWCLRSSVIQVSLDLAKIPPSELFAYQVQPGKTQDTINTLDTRPLRIYTHVHRITEGCFFAQFQTWMEKWAHPWIHSRRGGDPHTAFVDLSLHRDEMIARGHDIVGALVDSSKYFDLFKHHILIGMFTAMGLDLRYIGRQADLWLHQKVSIKAVGAFSQFFTPTNGVGQGHTFALVATAASTSVWASYVQAKVQNIGGGTFIDDRALRHTSMHELLYALDCTVSFDKDMGHDTNVSKSSLFSNSAKIRAKLSKHVMKGIKLKVSCSARYLGFRHNVGKRVSRMNIDDVHLDGILRMQRVGRLPVTLRKRTTFMKTAAVAKSKYPSLSGDASFAIQQKWRVQSAKLVGGSNARARAVEVRTCVTHDACTSDPYFITAIATMRDLRRVLNKHVQLKTRFSDILYNTPFDKLDTQFGVVRSFLYACGAFEWEIQQDLVITRKHGGSFKFLEISEAGLSTIANIDAADRAMLQLGTRVQNPKTFRKDYQGLLPRFDWHATLALMHNRGKSSKLPDRMLSPKEKGRVAAIIEGGLPWPCRTRHNGKPAVLPNASCDLCGAACRADAEHYFWNCKHDRLVNVRSTYLEHINVLVKKSKVNTLCDWKKYTPLRHCAITPEDPDARFYNPSIINDIPDRAWVQSLSDEDRVGECWEGGYKRLISDGSCIDPDDVRFATAACALAYGNEQHKGQRAYDVPGEATSYLAELFGVFLAVRSDHDPLWLSLDNDAVVLGINKLLSAHYCNKTVPKFDVGQHLWDSILVELCNRSSKIVVTWIPGHTDEISETHHLRTLVSDADLKAQVQADLAANKHAKERQFRYVSVVVKANKRIQFARMLQLMYLDVWQERLRILGIEDEIDPIHVKHDDVPNVTHDENSEFDYQPFDFDGPSNTNHDPMCGTPAPSTPRYDDLRVSSEPTHEVLKGYVGGYNWNHRSRFFENNGHLFSPCRIGPVPLMHRERKLDKSFYFDPYLWTPFRWYIDKLMWPKGEVLENDVPVTVAFAELVIDFEFATGRRVRAPGGALNPTWADKARIFGVMLRTLKRHDKKFRDAFPCKEIRTNSLHAFGVPKLPGLNKKPNFLQHIFTERMIAANALEYTFVDDCRKKLTDGYLHRQLHYGHMVPPTLIRHTR